MSDGNSVRYRGGVIRWLLLLVVPTVAFCALLSLPQQAGLSETTAGATLEAALLALGRLTGLILCGWLLVSLLLYTMAVITRRRWLVEALRPLTLPLVRRIAAGLATVTISLNTVSAVAQTTTGQPVVAVDTATLRQEATPTPNLQPIVEVQADEPCIAEEATGSYSAPLTWLVRPGDNLWMIAGEHLSIVLERAPTRDEHARYWVEVIDAARPLIRSGDPDLIYPGEEIPLPPTLDAGVRP
jgi:hypothetical protein